jgi:hypothetical protein
MYIHRLKRFRRSLMSLHITKLFKNPLALAGAALVMHIGAATAADSTGDAQQQARELLTGTTTAHSAPQSPPRDGKVTSRTADAQESARQLLLGTTGSRVGGAEAIKHSEVAGASGEAARPARPVAHGDAQAAARQLLLGQTVASDASRLTARRTR